MELFAVTAILAIAATAGITIAWRRRGIVARDDAVRASSQRDRERLRASIAYAVLFRGDDGEAAKRVAAVSAGPVVRDIDVVSWTEALARSGATGENADFLDRLVAVLAAGGQTVPLQQYSLLLDVVFALGFHADELARLRTRYAFEYVDPARARRPRWADRSSTAEPLYDAQPEAAARRVLGVAEGAARREIVTAWRKAAGAAHPDRFHGEPDEVRRAAEERFLEVVRAAELLLGRIRD